MSNEARLRDELKKFAIAREQAAAKLRQAKADEARWDRACAVIVPVLEAHPGWKWRDAVKYLRDRGELPDLDAAPDGEQAR